MSNEDKDEPTGKLLSFTSPVTGQQEHYYERAPTVARRCCDDEAFEPVLLDGDVVAICCVHCGAGHTWMAGASFAQLNPQAWTELKAKQKAEHVRDRGILFRIRTAASALAVPNFKVALLVRNPDDPTQTLLITDDNVADVRDTVDAIADQQEDDDDDDDDMRFPESIGPDNAREEVRVTFVYNETLREHQMVVESDVPLAVQFEEGSHKVKIGPRP